MWLRATILGLLLLATACVAQSTDWDTPVADNDYPHEELFLTDHIPGGPFTDPLFLAGDSNAITPLVQLSVSSCGEEATSITMTNAIPFAISGHINTLVVFAHDCFISRVDGSDLTPLLDFVKDANTQGDVVIDSVVIVGGTFQLQSVFTHTTDVKIESVSFYDMAAIHNSALGLDCASNCPTRTTLVRTHVI